MVTQKSRLKFTYEDYKQTPDDTRYELLDGELILVPAPRVTHQRTLRRFLHGLILSSPKTTWAKYSVRQPMWFCQTSMCCSRTYSSSAMSGLTL